nr:MAG TPA: hypothetical protein [Caudoviricetes sp.]
MAKLRLRKLNERKTKGLAHAMNMVQLILNLRHLIQCSRH